MPHRAPDLHDALRLFCLAGFAALQDDVDGGADVPFAFEEHDARGRTTFYEFRPLIGGFVESRRERLRDLTDARLALDALAVEPAAALFAGSLTGGQTGEEALLDTILIPLLGRVAESRGGFDWDDAAWEREYRELERALFGSERTHVAVLPLVGVEVPTVVELGGGVRVRPFVTGELSGPWPESSGLLPERFGRELDRAGVLELIHALPAGATARPDAAAELADATTALRLALGGALATGSVYFERIDRHPVGVKPMLPISAAQPPGETARLDVFRGELARRLRERVAVADEDRALGEALDRWELALFQDEPFRSEQLRGALDSLLGDRGGSWAAALRAALLLGETGAERSARHEQLSRLAGGEEVEAGEGAALVRSALVEVLLHGDRGELIAWLDDALLGARPAPTSYFARLPDPERATMAA